VEKKVVKDIIVQLNKKFGIESQFTTTCGKVLEYLGMMLDYSIKGKIKISMHEYIDKLLSKLPSDMNGRARTPVARHLFDVNQDARISPEAAAQSFHHLVAKLLFTLNILTNYNCHGGTQSFNAKFSCMTGKL